MIPFSHGLILTILLAVLIGLGVSNAARANVTMRLSLTHDIGPGCDETVYKVQVCAGEFTNECELLPSATRFTQAACAAQGAPEPLVFSVNSVENPIELDVTVTRVGDGPPHRLRRTEFLLTEGREVSVTSMDLTLIVRFQIDYFCLPNYFGKLCDKFCDTKAEEHVCDEWGNPICRSGYFLDQKSGECRQDQCVSMPNYCLNGGTCVNSPDLGSKPRCLCPAEFVGAQCELEHVSTTASIAIPTTQAAIQNTFPSTRKIQTDLVSTTAAIGTAKIVNKTRTQDGKTIYSNSGHQIPITKAVSVRESKRELSRRENVQVLQKSNSSESRYREILIPVVVITLVLALLTVCFGFIAWIWSRKDKKKKRPNKLTWNDSGPDSLMTQPKRWASVDQSPSRLYALDDTKLPGPTCLPSLNGTQFPPYGNSFDPDLAFGGPSQVLPSRYSAMDAFPPRSDNPWSDEMNRFATLPRPLHLRRFNSELARQDSGSSTYTQFTQLPRLTTSFGPPTATDTSMEHYLRASTLVGSSFHEPSDPPILSSMMSPRLADAPQHFYPSVCCSRLPSMSSTCCMNTTFEPLNNSVIYGTIPISTDPVQSLISPNDALISPIPAIRSPVTPTSVPPVDGVPSGAFNTLPPPPSEFADTFLKSEC